MGQHKDIPDRGLSLRSIVWREHRGQRIASLTVGAGTEAEAIARARTYLESRGCTVEPIGCSYGVRLNVGIAGLRRYVVDFRVIGGPA